MQVLTNHMGLSLHFIGRFLFHYRKRCLARSEWQWYNRFNLYFPRFINGNRRTLFSLEILTKSL